MWWIGPRGAIHFGGVYMQQEAIDKLGCITFRRIALEEWMQLRFVMLLFDDEGYYVVRTHARDESLALPPCPWVDQLHICHI